MKAYQRSRMQRSLLKISRFETFSMALFRELAWAKETGWQLGTVMKAVGLRVVWVLLEYSAVLFGATQLRY
jgi:hypothetical protein